MSMKVISFQLFEDGINIFGIFFYRQRIDKDVIYISNTELVEVFMKEWVNEYLKQSRGISQTK